MNSKILMSVMVVGIAVMMGAVGGLAYFSDTETASNNEFQAGTVDLVLSNDDGSTWHNGVTATWSAGPDFAPGDSVSATLRFKNDGSTGVKMLSVGGKSLSITHGVSGGDIASKIEITRIAYTEDMTYPYDNLVTYYDGVFGDGNPPLTLREFVTSDYYMKFWEGGHPPSSDYLEPNGGGQEELTLSFHFMEDGGNNLQGDTVSFDIEAIATDNIHILGKGGSCYGY